MRAKSGQCVAQPAAELWQALRAAGEALVALAAAATGQARPQSSALALMPASTHTVVDLVNEFLMCKARALRADRYLRQLRVSLVSFTDGRANRHISSLTVQDVESWLEVHEDWAARTARGYLGDVRTLFNFAVNRGYLPRNPALGVELPEPAGDAPIGIHTPEQVQQVLDTARRADLDTCRLLAVRYFAGLRSAEAHRITESDLKLEQNLLEVPAAKSKTRSRRLVTIQPNLRAWLNLGGELRPTGDMTIRKVIRLSKVQWAHNVTRHSFVSYHLAHFNNAAKTALEAGHSEQMLFAHYRALVTPAAAAQYWNVYPKL